MCAAHEKLEKIGEQLSQKEEQLSQKEEQLSQKDQQLTQAEERANHILHKSVAAFLKKNIPIEDIATMMDLDIDVVKQIAKRISQ